ncbi:HPr family phosphocarrier protein [Streptomyces sp. NPDC029080]|uniref:HPr family phosphocarrier protein n=1 Tax=Streptomyces sp. NPDC029080 TaxID=3155017 RepID=UPI003406071E
MSVSSESTTGAGTASAPPAPAPQAPGRHRMTVVLPADLHARPAGRVATAAPRFASTVRLAYEGRTAAATSVLALMALGATAGGTVELTAEGPDAPQAAAALAGILAAAE